MGPTRFLCGTHTEVAHARFSGAAKRGGGFVRAHATAAARGPGAQGGPP